MKFLVETTGNHMLLDVFSQQQVEARRPSVIRMTQFFSNLRGTKLRVIEELSDLADDASLAAARNAAELEEAIAALPRPFLDTPEAEPDAGADTNKKKGRR